MSVSPKCLADVGYWSGAPLTVLSDKEYGIAVRRPYRALSDGSALAGIDYIQWQAKKYAG